MERRKFKRIKNNLEIKIKLNNMEENEINETGKSINLSANGVLINYNKPIEIGTFVNVNFSQPNNNEYFDSKGKVVRIEINPDNTTYDIGIEFIGLSTENEKKLDDYILLDEMEIEVEEENSYYIEIELPHEQENRLNAQIRKELR